MITVLLVVALVCDEGHGDGDTVRDDDDGGGGGGLVVLLGICW